MTQYLEFSTEQEAVDASRVKWRAVLRRPKYPQDVTEFLYQVLVNPNDGTALGVISPFTRTIFNNIGGPTLVYLEKDDPVVVDTLAAIVAAVPVSNPVNSQPLPPVDKPVK